MDGTLVSGSCRVVLDRLSCVQLLGGLERADPCPPLTLPRSSPDRVLALALALALWTSQSARRKLSPFWPHWHRRSSFQPSRPVAYHTSSTEYTVQTQLYRNIAPSMPRASL